jgi:hypothetical protein
MPIATELGVEVGLVEPETQIEKYLMKESNKKDGGLHVVHGTSPVWSSYDPPAGDRRRRNVDGVPDDSVVGSGNDRFPCAIQCSDQS